MKRLTIFLLSMSLLTFSCKKNNSSQDTFPKDNIVYHDYNPDILLQTIRDYYYNQNPYCGAQPIPDDSSAIFEIDFNQDSINDFRIIIEHYQTGPCGHCQASQLLYISILPLDSSEFVSLDSNFLEFPLYYTKYFDSAYLMKSTGHWSNKLSTVLIEPGCGGSNPYVTFTNTYLCLKSDNMLGWVHLTRVSNKNSLIIKEFAINKTKNNPIRAGQRK